MLELVDEYWPWPETMKLGSLAAALSRVRAVKVEDGPVKLGRESRDGRAQRAFFSQLAHDAGHHIAWVRMDLTATWPPALPPTTATWPGSGKCPEIPAAG